MKVIWNKRITMSATILSVSISRSSFDQQQSFRQIVLLQLFSQKQDFHLHLPTYFLTLGENGDCKLTNRVLSHPDWNISILINILPILLDQGKYSIMFTKYFLHLVATNLPSLLQRAWNEPIRHLHRCEYDSLQGDEKEEPIGSEFINFILDKMIWLGILIVLNGCSFAFKVWSLLTL